MQHNYREVPAAVEDGSEWLLQLVVTHLHCCLLESDVCGVAVPGQCPFPLPYEYLLSHSFPTCLYLSVSLPVLALSLPGSLALWVSGSLCFSLCLPTYVSLFVSATISVAPSNPYSGWGIQASPPLTAPEGPLSP